MNQEHHHWYSDRVDREMGVRVFGHYGAPILVFPTSQGNEWEYEGFDMIDSLSNFLEEGRIKIFCVASISGDSWYNKGASPGHRSYMQAKYDEYIVSEVVPFIYTHCQTDHIAITTSGSSLGAYHAANSLFKHPNVFCRCLAMSGIYDMRDFMNGHYDDNFYFNNPVDYIANLSDHDYLERLRRADIRLSTGHGPWEDSGSTYRMSDILSQKGISHDVDNWEEMGGHDWPFWRHQMWHYVDRLF